VDLHDVGEKARADAARYAADAVLLQDVPDGRMSRDDLLDGGAKDLSMGDPPLMGPILREVGPLVLDKGQRRKGNHRRWRGNGSDVGGSVVIGPPGVRHGIRAAREIGWR